MNALELQTRLKNFAYGVVLLYQSLPTKKTSRIIEDPLLRSAFSSAADCRAACKAQSDEACKATRSIAFEEIDETLLWLEVIVDLKLVPAAKLTLIIKEADELTRVLASSGITLERKSKNKSSILNIK